MDPEQAQRYLDLLAAGAAIAWCGGFGAVLWAWRKEQVEAWGQRWERAEVFDPDLEDGPGGPRMTGEVEVAGDAEAMADRACDVLARWMSPGVLAIEPRHGNRVVFGATGVIPRWGLGACQRGVIGFESRGAGRSVAHYTLVLAPQRGLLGVAAACVALGFLAIVGGHALLTAYVVRSANPMVRYQVLQMLQAIHLLWPPFLFVWLHRQARRNVVGQVRGLIQNLPYLDGSARVPTRFERPRPPRGPSWPEP